MSKKTFLFSVAALGIFFRLLLYFSRRSLWLDESLISVNLLPGSLTSFLAPLKHCQVAPPFFVLSEQTMIDLLGKSELSLRLLPLIAGILAIFLFYRIVKKLLEVELHLPAMILFVFSYRLIYYSQEVKPYGIDVLFTILILWIALHFNSLKSSWKGWILISIFSFLAIWSSFPSILVIGSLALYFLWNIVKERDRKTIPGYAFFILVISASFFSLYLLSISKSMENPCLLTYWYEAENGSSVLNMLVTAFLKLGDIFDYYWYHPVMSAGAIFFSIVGLFSFFRSEQKGILIVLAGTIVLAIGASVAEKYPMQGRLSLYLSPLLFLLVSKGAIICFKRDSKGITRVVAILLVVIVFAAPVVTGGVRYSMKLFNPDFHCRPIFEEMKADLRECDEILVSRKLKYPFIFYLPELVDRVIYMERGDVGLEQIREIIASLPGGPCKVWVIVNEMNDAGLLEIEGVLKTQGTIEKKLKREGKDTPLGIFAYVFTPVPR